MSSYFDILNLSGIKVLANPGESVPLSILEGIGGQSIQENFIELSKRTGSVYSVSGTAPSVNNDENDTAALGQSFSQWSKWHDNHNNVYYVCLDSSAGSAVWSNLSSGGGMSDIVEDTTPQLGGDLDVNGNDIISNSNGDIVLDPNGTGIIKLNATIQSSDVADIGNLGASRTINWILGSRHTGILDQDTTITHSNESDGLAIMLVLSYDGSAQRTITWSDVDKWDGGIPPVTPAASSDILIVTLWRIGSVVYGSGRIFN